MDIIFKLVQLDFITT